MRYLFLLLLLALSSVRGETAFSFSSQGFLPGKVVDALVSGSHAPTWVTFAPEESPWMLAQLSRTAGTFSQVPVLVVPSDWKDDLGLGRAFAIYRVEGLSPGVSLLCLSGGRVLDMSNRAYLSEYSGGDAAPLLNWVGSLLRGVSPVVPESPVSSNIQVSVSLSPSGCFPDGRGISPGMMEISGGIFPLEPEVPVASVVPSSPVLDVGLPKDSLLLGVEGSHTSGGISWLLLPAFGVVGLSLLGFWIWRRSSPRPG